MIKEHINKWKNKLKAQF